MHGSKIHYTTVRWSRTIPGGVGELEPGDERGSVGVSRSILTTAHLNMCEPSEATLFRYISLCISGHPLSVSRQLPDIEISEDSTQPVCLHDLEWDNELGDYGNERQYERGNCETGSKGLQHRDRT